METSSTSRRSFLKAGAIVAAPMAVAAPVAVMADDGGRARLARMEDERAIEALQRKFLHHLNGTGDCSEFVASAAAIELGEGLRSIAEDALHEPELLFDAGGLAASVRCACRVSVETAFTGDSTVERMARFQGHGSHRREEQRVLATEFTKGKDGWRISGARFA